MICLPIDAIGLAPMAFLQVHRLSLTCASIGERRLEIQMLYHLCNQLHVSLLEAVPCVCATYCATFGKHNLETEHHSAKV